MKTGIITKPSAWLSSVSGGGHTDELFMGWAVGILKEEGEWMQVVTHYGYRGCLKKEGVEVGNAKDLQKREQTEKMLVITKAFTDVMEDLLPSQGKFQGLANIMGCSLSSGLATY